jgi:hypothetical protein
MSLCKECLLSARSALAKSNSTQILAEIVWNLYAECAYRPQGVRRHIFLTRSSGGVVREVARRSVCEDMLQGVHIPKN